MTERPHPFCPSLVVRHHHPLVPVQSERPFAHGDMYFAVLPSSVSVPVSLQLVFLKVAYFCIVSRVSLARLLWCDGTESGYRINRIYASSHYSHGFGGCRLRTHPHQDD